MNKQLEALWQEAFENRGTSIDIGRIVVCDVCNDDYTDSSESGGFIFGSYAYCPTCARQHLPIIREEGEERYIKAHCPEGKSFADFVRDYRPNNLVSVTSIPRGEL